MIDIFILSSISIIGIAFLTTNRRWYVDDISLEYELPIVAEFSATPLEGTAPFTVQFTDESTNTPTAWAWDFGDGETSTDQSPSHVYASSGLYDVELTASNETYSDTELKSDYVTVNASSKGTPSISLNPGRRGLGISTDGGVVPWGM